MAGYVPLFERGPLGEPVVKLEGRHNRRLHVFFVDDAFVLAVWMQSQNGRRHVGNIDLEADVASALASTLHERVPPPGREPTEFAGRHGRGLALYRFEGAWVLSLNAISLSSGRKRALGSIDLEPSAAAELASVLASAR